MSILPASAQIDLPTAADAAIWGLAAAALLIAATVGVFRRRSVEGPSRLDEREPVGTLWGIVLTALSAWVVVPALYAATKVAAPSSASTVPTTQVALTPIETVVLGIVSSAVVLAVLIGGNRLVRHDGLRGLGWRREMLHRAWVPGLIGVAVVIPLTFLAGAATQFIWELIDLEHPDAHQLLRILGDSSSPGLRLAVIVSAVVLAPMMEEMLFRGHIQTAILYAIARMLRPRRPARGFDVIFPEEGAAPAPQVPPEPEPPPPSSNARPRWAAILLTSFLFMLVHGELWMMPPIFFLSVCLGYAYERTGNLWVPMLIHATFNVLNITYFMLSRVHR